MRARHILEGNEVTFTIKPVLDISKCTCVTTSDHVVSDCLNHVSTEVHRHIGGAIVCYRLIICSLRDSILIKQQHVGNTLIGIETSTKSILHNLKQGINSRLDICTCTLLILSICINIRPSCPSDRGQLVSIVIRCVFNRIDINVEQSVNSRCNLRACLIPCGSSTVVGYRCISNSNFRRILNWPDIRHNAGAVCNISRIADCICNKCHQSINLTSNVVGLLTSVVRIDQA